MPVYDCGDPNCLPCEDAFGPDREEAIARRKGRAQTAEEQLVSIRDKIPMPFLMANDEPGAIAPSDSLDLPAAVAAMRDAGRRLARRAQIAEARVKELERALSEKVD